MLSVVDDGIDEATGQSFVAHVLGTVLVPHFVFFQLVPENWSMEGTNLDLLLRLVLICGMALDLQWMVKLVTICSGPDTVKNGVSTKRRTVLSHVANMVVKEIFFGVCGLLCFFVGWHLVPGVQFAMAGIFAASCVALAEQNGEKVSLMHCSSFRRGVCFAGAATGLFGAVVQLGFGVLGIEHLLYPLIYDFNFTAMLLLLFPLHLALMYDLYTSGYWTSFNPFFDPVVYVAFILDNGDCVTLTDREEFNAFLERNSRQMEEERQAWWRSVYRAVITLVCTTTVGISLGVWFKLHQIPEDVYPNYVHIIDIWYVLFCNFLVCVVSL